MADRQTLAKQFREGRIGEGFDWYEGYAPKKMIDPVSGISIRLVREYSFETPEPTKLDCLMSFPEVRIGRRRVRAILRKRDAWRKEGTQPKALRVIGWSPDPMFLMETVSREVFVGLYPEGGRLQRGPSADF